MNLATPTGAIGHKEEWMKRFGEALMWTGLGLLFGLAIGWVAALIIQGVRV